MTNQEAIQNTPESKFLRSRPGWVYWLRRYEFIVFSLVILVAYAIFLLPAPEMRGENSALVITNIAVFCVLVLAWSANLLVDADKPDLLKGIVAFSLIGVFSWLFYLYSGTEWEKLGTAFFNFPKLQGNWHILFEGLLVTLELAIISAVFSVIIGLLVAVLRSFGSKTLNIFLIAYLDLFRSIPMIVLMVVIYFAMPYLGIELKSITATIIALSLGYGAYAAESFRAGIESVHYGQIEAARALGLSWGATMRLIVLPQAIRVVIPPLTGNLVAMLKDTAVASVVSSPELLKRAKEMYVGKGNPTPLIAAAMIYLVILWPLVRIANMLENRMKKN